MIITFIIVTMAILTPLVIAGVVVMYSHQASARKKARLMIESGQITDMREFERVSKALSTTRNNHEAAYLYQKLQELRQSRASV